ncbi:MAG: DUF4395 family protein [Thiotrichales bacterium]|nr:DUF4395 family protein [Thiotrichales bacterium]
MHNPISQLWFRDKNEQPTYINEVAVRIRAGILLAIPLYMGLTLFDVGFGSHWIVDGNTAVDSGDTDFDGHIVYTAEMIRRTYDYTIQTWVLFYALFEMIAGMFVSTSHLSPTIWLSSYIARNQPEVFKPLNPKRMAWSIGAIMISTCIVFFNPVPVAEALNSLFHFSLPTEYSFMPFWIPVYGVWICIGFMWAEVTFGFCVGCKLHALLVKLGIFKEECEACNNIDWEAIAARHKAKLEAEATK